MTLSQIKQTFLNKLSPYGLKFPNDWLDQCIEFLQAEFPSRKVQDYSDLVYKQLLDFDLSLIGVKSLPDNVFNTSKGTLNGKFFLQIDLCLDATQSSYSKFQKLKGTLNENALVDADLVPSATQFEKREKKNRLLTLYLTDGEKKIKGIELQPINKLVEDNLLPGTKIELSGPIMFVNQVLYLKDSNVRILGGQVEGLTNLDYLVEAIQNELISRNENFKTPMERAKNFDTSLNQLPKKGSKSESNRFKNENSFSWSKHSQIKPVKFETPDNDEDELLSKIDLDSLEGKAQPNLHATSNSVPFNNRTNSVSNFRAGENPSNPKIKRLPSQEITFEGKNSDNQKNWETSIKNDKKKQKFEDFDHENEIIEILDQQSAIKLSNKENQISNKLRTLAELTNASFLNSCCRQNRPNSSEPTVFNLSTCAHKITRASFEKFTGPLRQIKLNWYEECSIMDASSKGTPAYIGNEVLSEMLELTALEARELFKRVNNQANGGRLNETSEYAIFEAKKSACEKKFASIVTCSMWLRFDSDRARFCITGIEDIERE